jgi:signal transduction histidine kinase/CheY-like chemotaxis protein
MRSRGFLSFTVSAAVALIVMVILIFSSAYMEHLAKEDAEQAVRSVSLLFLDELVGRRVDVIENNLNEKINVISVAIKLMTDNDLSDKSNLEVYQSRMKKLFKLQKFAFVDESGIIYTSVGTQNNIDEYSFDYKTISEPEISILNLHSADKKVIIAVPVDINFLKTRFKVCFMEINMEDMLYGISIGDDKSGATYSNIYARNGVSLSNKILGHESAKNNLLDVLKTVEFRNESSYEQLSDDFRRGREGVVSFVYNDFYMTLSYHPVKGTDWMMTYLIRKNVIAGEIGSVSDTILTRSLYQSLITVALLFVMYTLIIMQIRKNARLEMAKERADVENLIKHQELEEKLLLHQKLLEEEKYRNQQDQMITAMASDYRAVYYVNLDSDDGVCYRADPEDTAGTAPGIHFPFSERFLWYADNVVDKEYRQGFKDFINPENIRKGLADEKIIAYRYLAKRAGREYYEMIRVADVKRSDEFCAESSDNADNGSIQAIGLGFTVIDSEMRASMVQHKTLQDALSAAETANKAKTSFLSSMSHEIRTPMNAIIGLGSIALHLPDLQPQVRTYLEKIESSAHHLLNIINEILDMSRIESGRMIIKNEEFSFSHTLEQINTIISGQCSDKGLDYDCRIIGKLDDYYIGDDMKLRQIMINILGNAVKFTQSGGSVNFIIEEIARFEDKSTIRFTVSDTGIGMSRDFLPRIFDSFSQEDSSTTSKYGSTGLGMSITKCIVELMNGQISVESEKNVGTTFTVTLTLTQSLNHIESSGEIEINPMDMHVLVVDDDPVACKHAQLILSQIGISCDIASCGIEGVEKVKVMHTRRHDYNLILMDWKMPDIDGLEATKRIRAMVGAGMPVIMLTSYSWDDIVYEAKEAGIDTFVPKPLFAASIMDEFKVTLKRKQNLKIRKKADLTGRRILLAEDVAVNAEIMSMVLSMRKIAVEHAVNGRIAVEMFKSHECGYYDAVLMDMRMPEMDGLEASRLIRASDRPDAVTIPIIALTANAFDDDVQRSMQAGLNAHLSKPVDPKILYETLEELITDRPQQEFR